MGWADLFFFGLLVTIHVALAAWRVRVYYVRRRCRECGRARALRRVPGTRREGFVRLYCKPCGTKQWGVVEPEGEAGPPLRPF